MLFCKTVGFAIVQTFSWVPIITASALQQFDQGVEARHNSAYDFPEPIYCRDKNCPKGYEWVFVVYYQIDVENIYMATRQ